MFIDYMLSLYGSGCVSFGGDVHKYDWPWQGEGFIKLVLWKGCANTMDSWRVKGFTKKLVLVEGMRKYDGPWQGQGFIKWVLWEGVHKYDGLLEGEGFIQWVGPTSVFCVLKFGHGMVCQ